MSSYAEDLESAHPGAAGMAPGKLAFWNPRGFGSCHSCHRQVF